MLSASGKGATGIDPNERERRGGGVPGEDEDEIYKKRGPVAEFPNAWIKDKLGIRKFRLRGMAKAATEALWGAFTYNVQQWIRLSWRPKLMAVATAVTATA